MHIIIYLDFEKNRMLLFYISTVIIPSALFALIYHLYILIIDNGIVVLNVIK